MVPLEREIWDDLFSAAFANMIFALFNTAGFTSFSPMVCSFSCFAIKYATSYDAVKIGMSMSTKPKTGRIAFSSNLALFILKSANMVFSIFHRHAPFEIVLLVLPVLSNNCSTWRSKSCTENADSHHFL